MVDAPDPEGDHMGTTTTPLEEKSMQFTLRLPVKVLNGLREIAAREERSPSAEVRLLVRRHVEDKLREAA
jgi:hypothetical protein